ncbi:serine hydrolase [Nocardiopsis deserti]|uniref:serine hydrolase n=1 Tax=Nocardiopsis deserti TaxID=2605988 RepID=UPI001239BF1A|nr:serine hydrolase [Nocardiopsis deserti]
MPRHPPADNRARAVAVVAVVLAVLMAFALPGATSASGAAPPRPDPALFRSLVSESAFPLVPLAPVDAPETGGQGLTPAQREELTARIGAIGEEHPADFAVAVQDLRTGATFSHDANRQFPTASVAKLTILTMLLLRAEEEGRDLTGAERSQVSRMIRYSDNDVTDGLYSRIGFTDGFVEGARALGFTNTDPHPRGRWGATMTTAADQVRLLRALYCDGSPLAEEDRAYARGLMESVAAEQSWGVSASAGPDDTVGLKNGWTPREANGGLWNVNSVGYVAGPGREYLIAVLTDGSPDYTTGVALVEEVAAAVTTAMEEARAAEDPGG